ncbi:hypothetical protein CONCODRAFT_7591 [Conidiobolus coronatus NRRL 28638]|uniref:Arrestin-like N-terminal domain-containing protein n=1 Tax=Conidiobolus coronatus (strain ATCC 28846 / CBS 209.66 / NRRL 28638) TaxID=796925 RepID=A0A137P4S7_CONC2|nr:hypothetical protein CONCODRAFT_7591 [Conidiobolus coronatus NRRL 28638]|eukprot:KXN69941.1 hypothetical protein CONCODRAFT_7591 [Conidiobolus coronatus NRRL 28638]
MTECDNIYYNGNHLEAENVKIIGKLSYNSQIKENTTVYLSFTTTLLLPSKGVFSTNDEHVLYKSDRKFIFKAKANNYNNIVDPFEIILPGNLPTSISLDFFEIKHELKAYEKNIFGQSLLSTKIIKIFRLPRQKSRDYITENANRKIQLHNVNGCIENKASYSVKYPNICYEFDNSNEIEIKINPANDYYIKSITYSIKQTVELDNLVDQGLDCKSRYNYQLNSSELYTNSPSSSPVLQKSPQFNQTKNYRDANQVNSKSTKKLVLNTKFNSCNSNQIKYAQFSAYNEEFKICHFILLQLVLVNSINDELEFELIKLPICFLSKLTLDGKSKIEPGKLPSYEEVIENS